MTLKAQKVINGTHGAAWVNGEKWIDLESVELKVTLEYEDVHVAENTGTQRKFMGWVGEGSINTKKVYSRGSNLLAKAVKSGKMPEVTITTKLADPDAYGTERTTVSDVTFDEFMLTKIEQRTLMTEELPFKFGDFDILEAIK
ncbi:phage tail tube protein [Lysinibacillus pakistanensis]|uniref:phage tail tube protein n=1 Tax=Lysinibacillus pakistanensis TaxID=759811 RepID=UPI003D2BF4D9